MIGKRILVSMSGTRLKKFLLRLFVGIIFVALTVMIYKQAGVESVAEPQIIYEYSHSGNKAENGPRKWLLVTSIGSGGDYVAGLLKETPSSFYLHGPLKYLKKRGDLRGESIKLLSQLFSCNFDDEFADFIKGTEGNLNAGNCLRTDCHSSAALTKRCFQAKYIIMDTVELEVEDIKEEFEKAPEWSSVKIIYLARKPQAVLEEIQSLNLNLAAKEICPRIERDLHAVNNLKGKYPDRVFLLTFEDMALQSKLTQFKLWEFLQDHTSAQTPKDWEIYHRTNQLPMQEQFKETEESDQKLERLQKETNFYCENIPKKLAKLEDKYPKPKKKFNDEISPSKKSLSSLNGAIIQQPIEVPC